MENTFEINLASRNVLLKFLDNYSLEQLNKIPEGFSNNLIWNIAHIIVVQQMLVYNLSGLPMMVPGEMVAKYKRGTRPEQDLTQTEVDAIKALLFSTLEKTKQDFASGIFKSYTEFTTMTGFTVKTAEAAIEFNNYHEATHVGMMMQIRKFV
ncbi:MAG: DinB family protein [Flavobacterium sp.]